MVEEGVFPKPEFQEALKPFVRVRINAQGSGPEKAAYERLAEGFLPTYAVLEADGSLVARAGWQGGTDAEEVLLEWLKGHAR